MRWLQAFAWAVILFAMIIRALSGQLSAMPERLTRDQAMLQRRGLVSATERLLAGYQPYTIVEVECPTLEKTRRMEQTTTGEQLSSPRNHETRPFLILTAIDDRDAVIWRACPGTAKSQIQLVALLQRIRQCSTQLTQPFWVPSVTKSASGISDRSRVVVLPRPLRTSFSKSERGPRSISWNSSPFSRSLGCAILSCDGFMSYSVNEFDEGY
ncbi:hypothetical protein GGR57DRAFT_475738 [Xylariaceae sp. FL1272]|nr:hypothetical protein GGR57DRAFT_475738 [Xylariaceae sp. FL1272]